MLKLDMQSRLPIYEQLKNRIGELVLLRELKPGDQLPSVRSVARELGINPNTVQKAYQDLERDHIIYSITGRGSYISPDGAVSEQLRGQQLKKISQAVRQAKACTVTKEEVIQVVNTIYREGQNDDTGAQSDETI